MVDMSQRDPLAESVKGQEAILGRVSSSLLAVGIVIGTAWFAGTANSQSTAYCGIVEPERKFCDDYVKPGDLVARSIGQVSGPGEYTFPFYDADFSSVDDCRKLKFVVEETLDGNNVINTKVTEWQSISECQGVEPYNVFRFLSQKNEPPGGAFDPNIKVTELCDYNTSAVSAGDTLASATTGNPLGGYTGQVTSLEACVINQEATQTVIPIIRYQPIGLIQQIQSLCAGKEQACACAPLKGECGIALAIQQGVPGQPTPQFGNFQWPTKFVACNCSANEALAASERAFALVGAPALNYEIETLQNPLIFMFDLENSGSCGATGGSMGCVEKADQDSVCSLYPFVPGC
jgi:hypothetical protein